MTEIYVECLIRRKNNPMAKFLKVLLIIMAVASLLMITMFGNGTLMVIFFVSAIVFGVGAYFVHINIDLEYEYLYLDKELSIDKIVRQQSRKKVATYDLNKMEILAPIRSRELDSYKNRTVVVKDYSTREGDDRYVMFYDGKVKVIFSPSQELVGAIKTIAPRKVFDY